MNKKHKKVSTMLSYIENFLILGSAVTGCISISAFLLRKSAVGKKSRFITELGASGFLTDLLWAKSPLEEIALFGNIII